MKNNPTTSLESEISELRKEHRIAKLYGFSATAKRIEERIVVLITIKTK